MKKILTIKGKVWVWPGNTPWHFISLDKKLAEEIRILFPKTPLIKIKAKVGKTEWDTAFFRESKTKSYIMPLKKKVRLAEDIWEGEEVTVAVEIL
jgi:hypothetical protein